MIITKGATGTFGVFLITAPTTGQPETGFVFDDFPSSQIKFQVSGGAVTLLNLAAAAPNAAWSEGNFSELFSGYYQVALPDSISAEAGKMVTFSADVAGSIVTCEPIMVLPAVASDLANYLGTTYYVSSGTGSDSDSGLTPALAKATITAAKTLASAGDLIIVGAGSYNERDLLKDGVEYLFEFGAAINYTGTAGPIFDTSSAIRCKIGGSGKFQHSGASGNRDILRVSNATAFIDFECDEIVATGRGVAVGGGEVYFKCNKAYTGSGTFDLIGSTARFFGDCDYAYSASYVCEMDGGYLYLRARHIESGTNPIENQGGSIVVEGANIIAGTGEPISINVDAVKLVNCTFESDQTVKFFGGTHTFIGSPVTKESASTVVITSTSPTMFDLAKMIEDSGTATPQFTADSLYYGPQSTLISFGGMTVYLSVDQRVRLYIVDDLNKNPIEGLVAADITEFWYQRDGENKVVVVLADGSGLSADHVNGNFNEVADGWYQIDVPDTAWAKGSSTVVFGGSSTGNVILSESISLGSDVIRSPTLRDLDNMIDDSNTLTPQWSTDAMLKLPNLTVLPYVGTSITRSDSTLLDLYVGELMTNTINVKDRDGNPIDLSAFTLYMVIESFDKVDLQLLDDEDLGHAGAFVIFTNAAPVTANPTTNTNYHLYSLRKVGTHEVVIQGKIRVTYAALED